MIWLISIVGLLLLLAGWLLLSPFAIIVDTRIPEARLNWWSIGNARVWYDEEWQLGIRVLFFNKKFRLAEMKSKATVPQKKLARKPKRKQVKASRVLTKAFRVMRTFRVTEWKLAIDTGDHTLTANLYPLNFSPPVFQHLDINFRDENYLLLKIRNRPWRLVYAFLR